MRGIDAAVAGGADRIELCAALSVGGLTPSTSLVDAAAGAPIPVHMLARPREGDFHYTAAEAALVAADIAMASAHGLDGVVIGASDARDRLDRALLAEWVAHARALGLARRRPLALTLHRVFDLCPDPAAALEDAIALGFDRVLTSGAAPRAIDGLEMLAALVGQARGRITILAGGGIDAATAPAILGVGVAELHASCRSPVEAPQSAELRFQFQAGPRRTTDSARVAALREVLDRR